MTEIDHLQGFTFPYRPCDDNVVPQILSGISRCPECGVELPNQHHANAVILKLTHNPAV